MKRAFEAALEPLALDDARVGCAKKRRGSRRGSRRSLPTLAELQAARRDSTSLALPADRHRHRQPGGLEAALREQALLRLVLSFLDVRDHERARALSRSWQQLVQSLALDSLDLSTRVVPSSAALEGAVGAAMRSYRRVRALDLSGQRSLADRDLLVLSSHFWAELESIRADDCAQLSDFALFSVLNAQSLRLQEISFRGCKQLAGRFASAAVAGRHPRLARVHLDDTRVDWSFVSQLERAFPSLDEVRALRTPAHAEWVRGRQGGEDAARELRLLVTGEMVELPLLEALLRDFDRRLAGWRAAERGAFDRGMLREGRRLLTELPLEDTAGGAVSALLLAAGADLVDSAVLLLAAGADVDARARSLATPLYLASERGSDAMAALLLSHGARADLALAGGATPLCAAARNGHAAVATRLLTAAKCAAPQPQQPQQRRLELVQALFLACEGGHAPVVRELLRRSALRADELLDGSVTPLYLASQMGHTETAALLLSCGADASFTRPQGGVSCLYIAAQEGHRAVVELLLQRGAAVDARMADRSTALHIAARMGRLDVARALLECGAAPNAQTRSGLSPLHVASEEGHLALARALLRSGADPNARAGDGAAPLFAAAQRGHAQLVRVLLRSGADPDAAKRNGSRACDAAALLGHVEAARALVRGGARVSALALHLAERRRDPQLRALLLGRFLAQHNAPHNAPHWTEPLTSSSSTAVGGDDGSWRGILDQ